MNRRCPPAVLAVVAVLSFALPAGAQDEACPSSYSGLLQATYVDFDDRLVNDQHGAGLRLGIGRRNCAARSGHSQWELNANWNSSENSGLNDDDQYGLMLHRLRISGSGDWKRFWQAGAGFQHEVIDDTVSTMPASAFYPAIELGIGVMHAIGTGGMAFRADLAVQGVFNDDALTGDSFHHDGRLAVGLTFPLASRRSAARVPANAGVDSDGDGVADAYDWCPGTPLGRRIDNKGCLTLPEPDEDDDGVADASDACPATMDGLLADPRGCVQRVAQTIIVKGVHFDSSSSALDDKALQSLDAVYRMLIGDPGLHLEIGGHADSSGSAAENRQLARQRAELSRNYLVSKGIAPERLSFKGYSSAEPTVDNDTPEGRAINRRIELTVSE